jgi:hypothetical protein
MKIRGARQTLHWLFLAVGIFSLFILAFSVTVYMDYAREGYGLDASLEDAWLSDGRLVLRLRVENPGGMEIVLGGTGTDGNMTLGSEYPISLVETTVKAHNVTTVIVYADLGEADLQNITGSGSADIGLTLLVRVPERDAATVLRLEAAGTEVRP